MPVPVMAGPLGPTSQSEKFRRAQHESESDFAHLVSGVQDCAILLLDPDGNVASWNAGAQRIKGYSEEEIVGKHFSAFYPPEAVENGLPAHALRVAASQGRFADEGWRVRKDGKQFWASVAITAIRDDAGVLRAFFKITRDLTEQQAADLALRQSEERFRLLVDGVLDYAIFMLTPGGHIASWNRGAERLKGYKASEIIGHHFSHFYPPEAIAQGKPEWELRVAVAEGRVEDEGWRIRKDGSRFWANVVITALHDEEGKLRGFTKVTRDLTQRRQIEKLQEADHQKNQFLAMLAHELRNPLAPIRSAIQVLTAPDVPSAALARARQIAEHQVAHMSHLLDDLIDVSRIGEGVIELHREVIDVAPVVIAAVQRVQPLIHERRLQISVDVWKEALSVDADRTRLEQVVTNLLSNAAKYTDPGGSIWVSAERAGGLVVICVKDTGIGIDAAMAPRIFDPFVQAERRLDRSVGGVGIGLTLVKRLVESHGGTVEARSPGPGKGSEFLVRLPYIDRPKRPRPAAAPTKDRASAGPPLRILVADDNPDSADALAMLLEMGGDEVRVAYDGVAVLTAAEGVRPDVLLLDIGMPGMDGHEVARRLRALPATKDSLLVAISGWGSAEDRERSRAAGFDRHLVKPFDIVALEELLDSYRMSRRTGSDNPSA
jgi:PAS domain S-box-containing protein